MPFGRELHFDKVGLKTSSPNNQIRASGLEFSPAYAVQASFAKFVSKQVGREYPGNSGNPRGKVLSTALFLGDLSVQE